METHAFGFRLRANAPEGQKRFPISRPTRRSIRRKGRKELRRKAAQNLVDWARTGRPTYVVVEGK
jgi:hypothetical protein